MTVDFEEINLLDELTEEELAELNADISETDAKEAPAKAPFEDEFAEFLSQPAPKREKKAAPAAPAAKPATVTVAATVVEATAPVVEEDEADLDDDIAAFLAEGNVEDEASFDAEETDDALAEEVDEWADLDEAVVEEASEPAETPPWDEFVEADMEETVSVEAEPVSEVGDDLEEALAAFEKVDAELAEEDVELPDPSEEELPEGEVTHELEAVAEVSAELAEDMVVDGVEMKAGDTVLLVNQPEETPVAEEEPSVDLQALFRNALDAQAAVTLEFNRRNKQFSESRSKYLSMFDFYLKNLQNAVEPNALLDLDLFKQQFEQTYNQLKEAQEEMVRLQELAKQAQFLQDYVMTVKASPTVVAVPAAAPKEAKAHRNVKKVSKEAASLSDLQPDMVVKGKLLGVPAERMRHIKVVSVNETEATGVYRSPGGTWETTVAPLIMETIRLMVE